MEWLKDRPGLQILLNGLITVLVMIFMFFFIAGKNNDTVVLDDIQALKKEKASIPYVNTKIKEHAEYDKTQDERIETMRKEWREDHREILELIRAMR
jgi:hypothetical protein